MLRIFIWGTGHMANEILKKYDIFKVYDVVGFIDNDPCKQNKYLSGKKIYSPKILLTYKVDKIIILTVKFEEIYQQITKKMNLKNISIEGWGYLENQFEGKQGILRRYENTDNMEIKEILKYINQNDLEVFNYSFREKYKRLSIPVLYDNIYKMFYVIHQGKKLYFSRCLDSVGAVADYYKSLLMEQNEDSPHKYLDNEFSVCDGDIVVDAGVGEGNFALEVIDQVSKIYLIESDSRWIEALKQTFKNYQSKVVIIQKYLTSMDYGKYATLDSLIHEPVNFIKMDIEGNEWDALLGAEKLIKQSKKLKCAICSYHAEYDETLICSILSKYGLKCTPTHGYMWFTSRGRDGNISTKLRRGIIRGIR